MKLFCAGVGGKFPDIEDASRAIKKSEYDTCVKNGVKTIIEVPVGIDGLTIIEANGGPAMNLTRPTSTRRSPPIRSARARTRRRPGRTSIRRFPR